MLIPLKALVAETLNDFLTVGRLVEQAALFSSNETLDDIPTGDLKYLQLEAHLSEILLKEPFVSPESRIACLKSSLRASRAFLDRMKALDLVDDSGSQSLADLSLNAPPVVLSGDQARLSKIARYKQEKALRAKMDVR